MGIVTSHRSQENYSLHFSFLILQSERTAFFIKALNSKKFNLKRKNKLQKERERERKGSIKQ